MVEITGSEKRVYSALHQANGTMTVKEVAISLGLKPSSINTTINTLRKKFVMANLSWNVNPKSARGGNRAETVDLREFVNSLEESESVVQ